MFNNTAISERILPVDPARSQMEALELAGKFVEKHITNDNSFPPLTDRIQISGLRGPTVSGLSEIDYPNVNGLTGLDNIKQLRTVNKVPLPPEIMEHFGHMQCRCMMGIFSEINRAWLTIDSDIYIWDFETGLDVAYYDGLSETIISVGLVKPKPGIFQNYVRHLLVLTTTVEIIVLGVTFSVGNENVSRPLNELHLTPEIIYTLATDGIPITVISSTENGRIFLGGKDGSLSEILYQKELGWWGKRCKKVNHSNRALSFLVPSLINAAFSEEDAISQISVDNSRHILYTLSDKGTIVAYDLGENGTSMRKVHSLSLNSIVQTAFQIVKTLDSANFKPVVSISAVDIRESAELGLVAVTEIGARLYFTTGAAVARPSTLHLMHVRLPPGFAANAPAVRPNTVHMALYTSGNLLLVTSPGNNQDKVWCLSGEIFPLHPTLCEQQSVVPLDGIVWALREMKVAEPPNMALCEQPPLVVRQHYEPAKKFVVLTPQGAEILMISRPVDVLRQLLIDSNGPDSEAVKLHFRTQTEDQACATCLLIACNQSATNVQLAEWATRAFFLYGGEPRISTPQAAPHLSSLQFALPPGFNPSSVSTPLSAKSLFASPDNSTVLYSAKHNGLYLYIGRILRPLWNTRIVQKVTMSNIQYVVSSVVGDEVAVVAGQLLALRSFLEKNMQIASATPSNLAYCNTAETPPSSIQPQRSRLQEVQLQEKRSLDALKVFVDHACQVLGFWKIMCEHQFHVITSTLTQDQQNHMLMVTFRDLIIVEQELCSILINKLINTYLSDNTSIDPISLKLRDVCPKLYHNEDAACTKASEIINVAKTKQNKDERESLLWAALKLCKDVAPRVNLSSVSREFVSCQFYEGVVELSIQCAAKCDPKDVGFHFYKNNQPAEDTVGYQAYAQRMECYREVTRVLDLLYQQSQSSPYMPRVPSTPGPPPPQPTELLPSTEYIARADDLIKLCMNSSDQLLHVAVYDWMVTKRLYGDLINVAKPSLELYLKQAATNSMRSDMSEFSDLLWKYQEHYGNHAAAAQILYSLAMKPSDHVNLTQRITYLGKAVMCMRSDEVGCTPHLGVFLHDLEDLLQVAKVQKQVLDVISNVAGISQQADEAVHRLNSSLLTITELYQDYAEPFNLWECKLSIIECSGHNDPELIQQIWNSIIESELRKSSSLVGDDKMALVMNKVHELGKQYGVSSRCFPVRYLVWQLEMVNCELNASRTHVQNTLLRLGVSVTKLVDIYKSLFLINDRCWLQKGNEFYLIETIAAIGENITENPKLVKPSEKKGLLINLQDLILNCLSMLYSRPDTNTLINRLKSIQSNLNRL